MTDSDNSNSYESPQSDLLAKSNGTSAFSNWARWQVLILVALDYFTLYLHRSVLNNLQAPVRSDLNISEAQWGGLQAAFLFSYATTQILVSYLGDRFRRRTVLLGSLSASFVCVALMAFAQNYWTLFGLRIALGIAQSASVPAIASAMGDAFTPKNRSTAVAIYLFSYNVAVVLASTVGGHLTDTPTWTLPLTWIGMEDTTVAGWRVAIMLFALIGVVIAIVMFTMFREPPRLDRVKGEGLGVDGSDFLATLIAVLRVPSYWMIAFVFLFQGSVVSATQFWLPEYFVEKFSISRAAAGFLATTWIQVGTVAGLICGGPIADAAARRTRAGRTIVQCLGLAMWLVALPAMGLCGHNALLIVAMLTYGLGVGLYQANLWTTTFEVVDPAARSTAVGYLNVVGGTLGSAFPPLIGWMVNSGFASDFGVVLLGATVLPVICIIAFTSSMIIFLPRDFRSSPNEPTDQKH